MKILDRLFGRKRKKRSYEGAGIGRLLNSWTTTNKTPDELLRTDLKNLRVRSRDLAIEEQYRPMALFMAYTGLRLSDA
mgnify:CR=1 FL=1